MKHHCKTLPFCENNIYHILAHTNLVSCSCKISPSIVRHSRPWDSSPPSEWTGTRVASPSRISDKSRLAPPFSIPLPGSPWKTRLRPPLQQNTVEHRYPDIRIMRYLVNQTKQPLVSLSGQIMRHYCTIIIDLNSCKILLFILSYLFVIFCDHAHA